MWRFGGQRFPRIERGLLWALALAIGAILLAPLATAAWVFGIVWFGFALVFMLNCLQYQWHAWRAQPSGPNPLHQFLAVCWLVLLAVALHDLLQMLNIWSSQSPLNPIVGPISALLMALLVGGRFAQGMRRIEIFNVVLEERVNAARLELASALSRVHAQSLENAKLQERMSIAHDLHDGLGASLVRGLALVEQAPAMMAKERVLSLLKSMRDDLRQMVDHGASSTAITPESPLQWIAPVRHRFTRILDELNVASQWRIDLAWIEDSRPTALQCLGLTRIVEEALSNVIKHSQARNVRVSVFVDKESRTTATLSICIEDDGIGFDVLTVQRSDLSVGVRSMAARAERLGSMFTLDSGPCGTMVMAVIPLAIAFDSVGHSAGNAKSTGLGTFHAPLD